jgi:prepilin-type N-terminal cleavage/methylation domain-containing protein
MRRGFSLLELVIGLVILGLLSSAAVPAFRGIRDRYAVQAAATAIASAHNRARIRAILEGQVTELEIRPDSLILRVGTGGGSVPVWSTPGPLPSGVSMASPPRTLLFTPSGVTMGFANATFVVTRGGARRQVVVSRMGRVRVIP